MARPKSRAGILSGIIALLWVTFVCAAISCAAEISMEHHCWGRFEPGAWQESRTVTETLDETGAVVSVSTTEQTMTLVSVNDRRVKLRIESTVEIGGKKFTAPVQTEVQGSYGEVSDHEPIVEELESRATDIDGQSIQCQVHRYVIADQLEEKTVKVYYSPTVAPYVLRREVYVSGDHGRRTTRRSDVQVVAIKKPHRVLTDIVDTSHTKTVDEFDKGSRVTMAVHAEQVPGEIVSSLTREIDTRGSLVRRSTTELVDFGLGAESVPKNDRSRRARRRARR